MSRELRSRAAWEFLDRHCAKTAGCCAISIIIELVHGRIDGGRNGTERNGTAHIKSVLANARITAATGAIRSAVATQLSRGGLGRSRQKSKRASRLSIRPSCPRPGLDWHANRTSLYDPPFYRGLLPFLVAERKMRLDRLSANKAFISTLLFMRSECVCRWKSDDFVHAPGKGYNYVYWYIERIFAILCIMKLFVIKIIGR